MADVFPESMDRLDYQNVNESIHTIEDYINYICQRVDFTYGKLFESIGTSGVLAVPIALTVSQLQKDVKELQNQLAGVSAEATSALNKVTRLETTVGDDNSGLVKAVNELQTTVQTILTTIGSDDTGHESGILGALKEVIIAIGSDEAGHESGILGELKDHEQRITALENQ